MPSPQAGAVDPYPYQGPDALAAWNLMGGINAELLPVVAEMFGRDDIEVLIRELAVIRDFRKPGEA